MSPLRYIPSRGGMAGLRIRLLPRHSHLTRQLTRSLAPLTIQRSYAPDTHKIATTTTSTTTTATTTRHITENDTDLESRWAINTEHHEYSQSGSDSDVARQHAAWDLAFKTPERVREASLEEALHDGYGKTGPLEVSPANREVSNFSDESGRGEFADKGPSRRVSPPKGKRVDFGGRAVVGPGPKRPEGAHGEGVLKLPK
ncbi:hypothetical protein FQN55_006870 [Onygenales sp. PD_40]|nr:hypothetical protein FQN55_006870 [Onygenales sp. PD_40]KAK2777567.1 hypothetical protein FQN53_002225 [Emmonsiellopsis sp. PD_33]KAK2784268.1 hypothetical protein FQN52_009073 [Onygenales sp. PD_12]KAK2805684.1 hypothetical protein FQN51_009187 [Onygenales sp. PD_10]